jgi:glycosyltransferase involved in cell wall biosynthesis
MPKVSVIIPCFNQGIYLDEAVASVLAQTFQDFEILIVDDGSTDAETVNMLQGYARPKTRVIHTDNQGLSMARNNGIREAMGVYILPLDADDKIGPGYLEDAVRILDRHPEIGIVYCEASYFGVKGEHWDLPEYSLEKILNHNVIFCTAFFRKEDWTAVGGYNVNMVYGWEDWDFWLSLIHRGRKVYRIPRVHFFYRLKETSMIQTMDEEKQFFMRLHAILNHRDLYQRVAEINIRTRVTELFFDTGIGFTPHQVIRQVIFGEEHNLEFDLSPYGNVRQVRFHPINAPAAIHLERVEVTDGEGHCHAVACAQSNAVWAKDERWLFQDGHPWIILDVDHIVSPQKISFHLRYLAIGHEIYPEIIKIKEQEIEQKQKMIQDILHSTSWKLTRPLRRLKEMWRA